MNKGRIAVAVAFTASFLWVIASGASAYGGNSGGNTKPFDVHVTPAMGAGETSTFTITIQNEDTQQTLGSLDMYLPAGTFVLPDQPSATYPNPIAVTSMGYTPSPAPTVSVSGGVVLVRGMSLPANTTSNPTYLQFQVIAYAPCFPAPQNAPWTWTVVAKQANDFSGQPGNAFNLNPAKSQVTATTSGQCSLQFIAGDEPAQGQVGKALSNIDFTTPGTVLAGVTAQPIAVRIYDDETPAQPINANDASASTMVTVGPLSVDPKDLPSQSTHASGGVASFDNLVPTQAFTDKLLATMTPNPPQVVSTTSDSFEVWGSGQICVSNSGKCTPTNPVTNNGVTANASGNTNDPTMQGFAEIGVSQNVVNPFNCGDRFFHAGTLQNPVYTTVEAIGTLSGTVQETITIGSADVLGPASQYEICYEDPGQMFDVLGGGVSDGGPALLATCKQTVGTGIPLPCVSSIAKAKQGGIVEIIDAAPNDPHSNF